MCWRCTPLPAQTVPAGDMGGTPSAPSGSASLGGAGGSSDASAGNAPQSNPMDNLDVARAFASQNAFKKRSYV